MQNDIWKQGLFYVDLFKNNVKRTVECSCTNKCFKVLISVNSDRFWTCVIKLLVRRETINFLAVEHTVFYNHIYKYFCNAKNKNIWADGF